MEILRTGNNLYERDCESSATIFRTSINFSSSFSTSFVIKIVNLMKNVKVFKRAHKEISDSYKFSSQLLLPSSGHMVFALWSSNTNDND